MKTNKLSKDEYQDIVNYGADEIFWVGNDITEEDIDALINKGETIAQDLNLKAEGHLKDKFNAGNFELN